MREVLRVRRATLGQRHLVGAPGALDRHARRRSCGPVQPFGVRSTIIGQRGRAAEAALARVGLDRGDLVERLVERRGQLLVHVGRVVARRPAAAGGRSPSSSAQQLVLAGSGRAPSGSRSCSRSGAGSAAPRRRAPGSGTCSSASSRRAARSRPRRRRRRRRRAGRGCRTPRRRRGPASSRARRPRGSSRASPAPTWLGIPPGNENCRNSLRIPSLVPRRSPGRARCRCPRGRCSRPSPGPPCPGPQT